MILARIGCLILFPFATLFFDFIIRLCMELIMLPKLSNSRLVDFVILLMRLVWSKIQISYKLYSVGML